MTQFGPTTRRRVGRPRVTVTAEQVKELRKQGMSWRPLAKALGIGTATAMRLLNIGVRL